MSRLFELKIQCHHSINALHKKNSQGVKRHVTDAVHIPRRLERPIAMVEIYSEQVTLANGDQNLNGLHKCGTNAWTKLLTNF